MRRRAGACTSRISSRASATHFGTLVSIGLIYLGITVAVALVVGLATGAGMWTLLGSGDADPAAVAGAGLTLLLAFLVMMALLLPVFMALWFAPALVVFHERVRGRGDEDRASSPASRTSCRSCSTG